MPKISFELQNAHIADMSPTSVTKSGDAGECIRYQLLKVIIWDVESKMRKMILVGIKRAAYKKWMLAFDLPAKALAAHQAHHYHSRGSSEVDLSSCEEQEADREAMAMDPALIDIKKEICSYLGIEYLSESFLDVSGQHQADLTESHDEYGEEEEVRSEAIFPSEKSSHHIIAQDLLLENFDNTSTQKRPFSFTRTTENSVAQAATAS